MRLFAASIVLAVLMILFGMGVRTPVVAQTSGYEYVSTGDLTAIRQGRAAAPAPGSRVELMLAPTTAVIHGDSLVLHDDITGMACAASDAVVKKLGRIGDDFLVVRGSLGVMRPGIGGEVRNCEVVAYNGLLWEAERGAQQQRQRRLREAGRA
jgi:hypothetical protein